MRFIFLFLITVLLMSGLASATLISNNTEINITNSNINYVVNRTFAFENITATDTYLFIDNMTLNYSQFQYLNSTIANKTNHWPLGEYGAEDIITGVNGTIEGSNNGVSNGVYLKTTYFSLDQKFTAPYDITDGNGNFTVLYYYDPVSTKPGSQNLIWMVNADVFEIRFNYTSFPFTLQMETINDSCANSYPNYLDTTSAFTPDGLGGTDYVLSFVYNVTSNEMNYRSYRRYSGSSNTFSLYTQRVFQPQCFTMNATSLKGNITLNLGDTANSGTVAAYDELQFYERDLNDTELLAAINYRDYGFSLPDINKPLFNTTIYFKRADTGDNISANFTFTSVGGFSTPVYTSNQHTGKSVIFTDSDWTISASSHSFSSMTNTTTINTTDHNITFFLDAILEIDNCSLFTDAIINFSIKNITSGLLVDNATATASGYFEITPDTLIEPIPLNITWRGNNFQMCVKNNSINYTLEVGQMEYNSPTFQSGTYYFDDWVSTNNITHNINLFLNENTTSVEFTVIDTEAYPVNDVLIYIMEYNLTTNSAETVSIIRTDTQGNAIGKVTKFTKRYKFLLIKDDDILLETSDIILTLDSYNFQVNLISNYINEYDNVKNVSCSIVFDNSSKTFIYTYSDPADEITLSSLTVNKITPSRKILMGTDTSIDNVGVLSVNITDPPGNYSYVATGEFILNNNNYVCTVSEINFAEDYKIYGDSGLLVSFLLILTMILASLWNPVAAVVIMLFGFVTVNVLGLFHLNITILVSFISVGIITIWRLSKK